MGISLTGLTPSTTYDALIKVGDNGPIDGTLKTLSDGLGNDLPMEVSTTGVNFTNNLTQGGTALQPVLVSGTNIKTINGASLLGSGNIPVVTSPSGVAGAIQFSNGSAFASDAANLFWDDTNNRLGVGTNSPSATAHFQGSGSTFATTSLLVQNSAGKQIFKVSDDASFTFGSGGTAEFQGNVSLRGVNDSGNVSNNLRFIVSGSTKSFLINANYSNTNAPSAMLEVQSTTKGFLPPVMTTTQKNAIASPAAGLVVYDSTTNKLCCYNGSTWNDLF